MDANPCTALVYSRGIFRNAYNLQCAFLSMEAIQEATLSVREATPGAIVRHPAGREVPTPKPSRPAGHRRLVHGETS